MESVNYILSDIIFFTLLLGTLLGYFVGYYQRKCEEPQNIQELIRNRKNQKVKFWF